MARPRRVPRIDLTARVRERTAVADEWRRDSHPFDDGAAYWADLRTSMLEEGDLDWLGDPQEQVLERVPSDVATPEVDVLRPRQREVPLLVDLSPEAESLQAYVNARLAGELPAEPIPSPPPVAAPSSELSDFARDLLRRAESPGAEPGGTTQGPTASARAARRSPRPLPELLSTPDAPPRAPVRSTPDPG